jgi:hypothetical protein
MLQKNEVKRPRGWQYVQIHAVLHGKHPSRVYMVFYQSDG